MLEKTNLLGAIVADVFYLISHIGISIQAVG